MDLGLAFEDEDLECSNEKNTVGDRHLPYNVKICSNQWFENALQDFDLNDSSRDMEQELKIHKFSADFHYREKNYTLAAERYEALAEHLLCKVNSALWLDVQESLSRSYMYSGQMDKGLLVAHQMVKSASTEDEPKQRQSLSLLAFACEKAEQWAECVDALERLCELQPQFAQSWHKLGDIYNHIIVNHLPACDKDVILVKQLSSYLRAKLLFQSVMGTISDFIKDRNLATIEQLTLKIDKLPLPQSRKEFASEFIVKEIENQASSNKDSQDSVESKDESAANGLRKETFYEKFCSWTLCLDR